MGLDRRGRSDVRILCVAGSPRKRGSSRIMLEAAEEGIRSVRGVEVVEYDMAGRRFLPCTGCLSCARTAKCCLKDDFDTFFQAWLQADAVLYSVPVYHMGVPGSFKSVLDRLGNVMFSYTGKKLPRFLKVGGCLAQGSSRFGGQELVLQYLISHLVMMNCLPVSGDTPACYLGAPGYSPSVERGGIAGDPQSLQAARNLGVRLAETARVVKAGLACLAGELPQEYFWSSAGDGFPASVEASAREEEERAD